MRRSLAHSESVTTAGVGNDLEEAELGGLGLVEQTVLLLAAHAASTQIRAHQCFERRMASLRHPLAPQSFWVYADLAEEGEDNGNTPTAELAYFGESCAGWLGSNGGSSRSGRADVAWRLRDAG